MYLFVKNLTLFTVWLFCKRFTLYNREAREIKTPLIIGCNHPNSFLDAILVGAQMKQRVHFITRSDVFKKAWVRAILRSVNMIPIYRIRDGKDNLGKNDQTFEECRQILLRGEHVLIFVEGFCKYQTSLQLPLKKGAPRMFIQALEDGLNIQCLPVWLRYSSFFSFPKEVDIHFGTVFGKEVLNGIDETGARMNAINQETGDQLQVLSEIRQQPASTMNKALLFVPALLAIATHFLFYVPVQQLAHKLKGEIHYDSILFCMIAFLYPVYLFSIAIVTGALFGLWWALLTVVLLPLLARAYVLWK